uniref:CKLF like MARVEL transmembrane domain containing 6 n=1 Tax=Ovis aries TaxID=9940 RepID=A0AC11CYH2_SHEEP
MEKCQALQHRSAKGAVVCRCGDSGRRVEVGAQHQDARRRGDQVTLQSSSSPGGSTDLWVLSLLAFICEEVVSQCTLCGGLYFFEFVSCSAFLLSLLILIVYCTPVYDRVDPAKVKSSDFYITLGTGLVFFVASIIFALTHDNTITEIAAIVFGMLASLAYVADFSFMLREKCKEPQPRKGEAAVRRECLTEPLNA